MATRTDVTTAPLSGYNHIDALLNSGPAWNYLTNTSNTLFYTFATGGVRTTASVQGAYTAFSAAQQQATRTALAYLTEVTGIAFVETTSTTLAHVHFTNADIVSPGTVGLHGGSFTAPTAVGSQTILSYDANSSVYLDNVEWGATTSDLTPGGEGYHILLHELGHMLGLGHPFDGDVTLPWREDDSDHTIMSYDTVGAHRTTFAEYDLAALKWLYGGDGLRGALGINSFTGGRWLAGTSAANTLTGTAYADKLEGLGGDDILDGGKGSDVINGGAGTDTARYSGLRSAYLVTQTGQATWIVSGADGFDTLSGVEKLQFSDTTVTLGGSEPFAISLLVKADTAGRLGTASGNSPTFEGWATAGAKVQVLSGSTVLGTVTAAVNGAWSLKGVVLPNGKHEFTARTLDSAGRVSDATPLQVLDVDSYRNFTGTDVNNTYYAGLGTNHIDGGAGTDIVDFAGKRANFTFTAMEKGYKVTDNVGTGGSDVVLNVERFRFDDMLLDASLNVILPAKPTVSISPLLTPGFSPRPMLSGTGEPGMKVEVFQDGVSMGAMTINILGNWFVTPAHALPNGSYAMTARASDEFGNVSALSDVLTVTVANTGYRVGTDKADKFTGAFGDQYLDGGAGTDTLVYTGPRANFVIEKVAGGFATTDRKLYGKDMLVSVERLQFDDKMVALDTDGVAGQAYRLYQAAFDRTPDAGGLGYWIAQMDKGASLRDVAAGFMGTTEFTSLYGGVDPANADFVAKLYGNVLHRAPDAAGRAYWLDMLDNNKLSKADVLAQFAESPENGAQLALLIGNGFDYTLYTG